MNKLQQFYGTAVGKKFVVAITGIMMAGLLVMHMIGNLKAFAGQEKLDHYAAYLREIGQDLFGHATVLWIARVVLIGAVVAHILADLIASLLDPTMRSATLGIVLGGMVPLLFIPLLEKYVTKSDSHIMVGDHEDIAKDLDSHEVHK